MRARVWLGDVDGDKDADEGGGEGRSEDGEQRVLGGTDGGGAEHGWVVDGNY